MLFYIGSADIIFTKKCAWDTKWCYTDKVSTEKTGEKDGSRTGVSVRKDRIKISHKITYGKLL